MTDSVLESYVIIKVDDSCRRGNFPRVSTRARPSKKETANLCLFHTRGIIPCPWYKNRQYLLPEYRTISILVLLRQDLKLLFLFHA